MKLQRKFLNRPDLRQENGKVTIIVWSPGLVVMGRESRSEGRGFESRHYILDGHFSHIFVVKIVMIFVWKDQNQTKNRQGLAHFYNNNHLGPILLTYLLTYLPNYSLTYALTYLLTCVLVYIRTYLLTYLRTYALTYLRTYLLTYLRT